MYTFIAFLCSKNTSFGLAYCYIKFSESGTFQVNPTVSGVWKLECTQFFNCYSLLFHDYCWSGLTIEYSSNLSLIQQLRDSCLTLDSIASFLHIQGCAGMVLLDIYGLDNEGIRGMYISGADGNTLSVIQGSQYT